MARKAIFNDEAGDLTDAELAEMRPASEVLHADDFAAVTAVRRAARARPSSGAPKVPVTIRLDPEVVAAFKATGTGWQTRMNEALRKAARELKAA